MPKDKTADQFSDDDMSQIKHYGQMIGGGVTPFDEAVEEALEKRQAAREANAKRCTLLRPAASLGLAQARWTRALSSNAER